MNFTTVAVSGTSSNAGKTSLVCELLRALNGWEAIKITRGHYRSCGKDPQACCVSHLLKSEPVIYSGRAETYAQGKDTGRFWDAGATNVHWLIVNNEQVERGIHQTLARVKAPGVVIEGTSFLNFVKVDFAIMAARLEGQKLKPSARRVLSKVSALYLFDEDLLAATTARERIRAWLEDTAPVGPIENLPVYTRAELPQLIARVRSLHESAVQI